MSLQKAILGSAVKQVPRHAFSRAALRAGLASLPPSESKATTDEARESVIDTLFGADSAAPRALVAAWEEAGAGYMGQDLKGGPKERVHQALSRRLEWSAKAGEHLVDAYALLATPSTPSIPIPKELLSVLESLRPRMNIQPSPLHAAGPRTDDQMPPPPPAGTAPPPGADALFTVQPNGPPAPPFTAPTTQAELPTGDVDASFTLRPQIPVNTDFKPPVGPDVSQSTDQAQLTLGTSTGQTAEQPLDRTGDRLPLPFVNAAAPLAYAWRVADAAVYAARPNAGKQGVMREPLGAGVEWYTARAGLAAAYLDAEAYLLQPFEGTAEGSNPHLQEAQAVLGRNLRRYADIRGTMSFVEDGADKAIGFLELMGRSIAGIIRSRGM